MNSGTREHRMAAKPPAQGYGYGGGVGNRWGEDRTRWETERCDPD